MCDDGIGCNFRISFHFFQKRVKIILHYVEDRYGILHFLLGRVKALESTDLLKGSIWKSILIFSLPLLVGNLFQQLYNTVDSYVVGNFVSSHALAAVGQSTSIINMLVGFFMGLSTGAGVVIAQYFGAKETKKMQDSIHTSLALTLVLCVLFTILGIALSKPILVMHELMHTDKGYKVYISKIRFSKPILSRIISIGIPAALQNSIVSFSNVIVQSYISKFGSAAVAGYSTTTKLDGFLQLPIQSFSMAITTFVGQNYGAQNYKRVRKGLYTTLLMCEVIIALGAFLIYTNGEFLVGLFSQDKDVIVAGVTMISVFAPGYIFLPLSHITVGALRGVGLSKVPMYSMILCFVILRQVYLFVATQFSLELITVFLGWPLTWIVNAALLMWYYHIYSKKLVRGDIY